MKHGLTTLIALTCTTLAIATTSAHAADFAGVYRCKGSDPYLNKDYAGVVTVTKENATVYSLEMDYDTGEKSIGTAGVYEKNLLSVVFQDKNDLKNIGLQQYHSADNFKTMSGYWVYLGQNKLGKETCIRK